VKDPAGNTWSYTYDLRGRQTSATDPDRGTTRTGYDNAGQVTSTTDARGQTLVYVRDKLGRQTALRENSTTGTLRATWVYDTRAKGQLTSATRRNGADRYTVAVTGYDDGYRPLGQSVTIPSAETGLAGTYTTRYTYAPNGQQLTTQLPALGDLPAETVTYNYDALSRPLDSVGLRFLVANTRYDEYGRPVMIDMGASFSNRVYHDYDEPTGRVTNTSLNRFNTNMLEMSTAFTYDAAGNTLSAIDRPEGGFATDAQCFTYDGLRRLTEAWTPASEDCTTTPTAAGLGGPAPYWFRDTFDPVGNRTQRVATTRTTRVTTDYTYPAPGQPRAHAPSRATHTTAGDRVMVFPVAS
jgi:YD repeat-containing protein